MGKAGRSIGARTKGGAPRIIISVPPELLGHVERAARSAGVTVSEWVRRAVGSALLSQAGDESLRVRGRARLPGDADEDEVTRS